MRKKIMVIFLISLGLGCGRSKRTTFNRNQVPVAISYHSDNHNILRYTEDFGDKSWSRKKVNIANNAVLDPNGNPNADLVDISMDRTESRVFQVISDLEEGYYAFSVYAKAVGSDRGTFAIGAEFKGERRYWQKSVRELNNVDWERLEVQVRVQGEGSLMVYPAYALIKGATLQRAYLWGAQLERIDSLNSDIQSYRGNDVILNQE